ncbi:hypothetical protein EJ02DRAFT_467874 [Clathrospora elynae]|uniref:Uncharacterized protein n=1 Tax=Clathrospora elynae TaxID=706981 RepID=A0A6A5SMN7_9PLEO|nr:hypothetical protein EJ02DRAFT_467874 [Clathrospora elynae]
MTLPQPQQRSEGQLEASIAQLADKLVYSVDKRHYHFDVTESQASAAWVACCACADLDPYLTLLNSNPTTNWLEYIQDLQAEELELQLVPTQPEGSTGYASFAGSKPASSSSNWDSSDNRFDGFEFLDALEHHVNAL